MMKPSRSHIGKSVSALLQREPYVVACWLFGSFSKERANYLSDIDIAVLFLPQHVPQGLRLLELREQLGQELKKEVDLVCLNNAGPVVAMQVAEDGKIIFIADERHYYEFMLRLPTEYADLKRIRAPIEKKILQKE